MEKKLEELQEQLDTLKEQIRLLSICKVTSDEFPYYNFLVTSGITSTQRSSINLLFLVLSELMKGKLEEQHIKVLKELKAELIVDENKEISYTEVMNTFKKILNVETSGLIEEMFDSMLQQGVKTNIVNHLKTNMVFDQL
ncbi:hypothetical protein M3603_15580 [Rummeliibacillus stabekisii]|uniref:hypothetical protein n=1 Tax=Rummeliibacillus stabekisii TaxID=241244 RepID=UPI00203F2734|nr:hypothetical protein [Rummeliibacillus stabekisii]MCM3318038.1 hypothetical protein [Rummeliibacillus stabekisii]